MSDRVVVGAIAGAYGVRGEIRLKSFCANPEDVASYTPIEREDGSKVVSLVLSGKTNNALVARIDGITTKEQADASKGEKLYVPRDALPPTSSDEYYYSDLVGMVAFDTGGTEIGKVKAVVNHGAGDLLELHLTGSSNTSFIPFTHEIVPTVDIETRKIVIDAPDGLMD